MNILGTYHGRRRSRYLSSSLVLVLLVEFEPEVLVGGRLKHTVAVFSLAERDALGSRLKTGLIEDAELGRQVLVGGLVNQSLATLLIHAYSGRLGGSG